MSKILEMTAYDNSQFDMNEYLARTVLEQLPFAVLLVNMHGHICYSNEGAKALLVYNDSEISGMAVDDVVLSDERIDEMSREKIIPPMERMNVSTVGNLAFCRKKDDQMLLADVQRKKINLWNGQYQLYTITDMTPYRQECESVTSEAHTDSLTGIYNRRGFNVYLEHQLNMFKRDGVCLALMFIDVDHFKHINDFYGHHYGDEVLSNLASIIKNTCRDVDIVSRFGGDELAILLPSASPLATRGVADRILSQINQHNWASGKITCSIGFTVLEEPDYQKQALVWLEKNLLACADKAMYQAKQTGKNRIETKQFSHQS